MRETAPLSYPKPGWRVLLMFWGCCVSQINEKEYAEGGPVEQMCHEPLGFVSGAFKGAQLN